MNVLLFRSLSGHRICRLFTSWWNPMYFVWNRMVFYRYWFVLFYFIFSCIHILVSVRRFRKPFFNASFVSDHFRFVYICFGQMAVTLFFCICFTSPLDFYLFIFSGSFSQLHFICTTAQKKRTILFEKEIFSLFSV